MSVQTLPRKQELRGDAGIAARIRAARETIPGLTQEIAAERLDITSGHLSHMETCKRDVPRRMLRRMAEVYKEDESWLATGRRGAEGEDGPEIDEIVRRARELDPDGRAGLLRMVRLWTETWQGRGERRDQ